MVNYAALILEYKNFPQFHGTGTSTVEFTE